MASFRFRTQGVKSHHDMDFAPWRFPRARAVHFVLAYAATLKTLPTGGVFFFVFGMLLHLRHNMTNEQQALAEMPIWLVIVLALVGGVSGEMWRADKDGARGWALMRRLALRSGACIVCGVSAMMLMIAAGMSIWTAGALGCLTAMAGADVAIGLYERWAAKRLGVCEVPPAGGEQG